MLASIKMCPIRQETQRYIYRFLNLKYALTKHHSVINNIINNNNNILIVKNDMKNI